MPDGQNYTMGSWSLQSAAATTKAMKMSATGETLERGDDGRLTRCVSTDGGWCVFLVLGLSRSMLDPAKNELCSKPDGVALLHGGEA